MPIFEVIDDLKRALREKGAAVLIAPPGAGKTTAVPLALLDEPWLGTQKIIVLEPRRLAARTAALRMADTLRESVGECVGYRMRMDNKISTRTRIEIVTEGVFQRMILDDPELKGVGCVIFDEFHERSLDADFGLALCLDVKDALRDDLRVLVMSATLDGAQVTKLLGDAPLIESRGKIFDVTIRYAPRDPDQTIEQAMAATIRKALVEEEGSILCFLPGQGEIRRTAQLLENKLPANAFVAPLFGAMDIGDQALAVQPAAAGKRKIVLATSLAETSITIDGVRVVIDSGLARLPQYEAALGISRLETRRASKASIAQRAGRAGRTAPGVAIRLWAEAQTNALPAFEEPEILQADLSALVLNSLCWGVGDISNLKLLDMPPPPHLIEARKQLSSLAALDMNGNITAFGRQIAAIPLEPRLAAMIVAGKNSSDRHRRAFLAFLLGERGLGGNSVDIAERFDRAWRDKSARAVQLRDAAARLAGHKNTVDSRDEITIGEMLCDAMPDRLAKKRAGQLANYTMVNGRGAVLDDADPLAREEYIIIADLMGSAKAARILSAAAINENIILQRFRHDIMQVDNFSFDEKTGRLSHVLMRKIGAVTLSQSKEKVMPSDATSTALCDAVRQQGLAILPWTKVTTALYKRLKWLYATLGDPWPDVSDDSLLGRLDEWLLPFLSGKTGFQELSSGELQNALLNIVPHEFQRQIDVLAPSHFEVPTGSRIALDYEQGKAPVLSVRVQELFGLQMHPAICRGKVPLIVELLSPAMRPIQITTDLPAFWQGSWQDVRKDLRGRYPRHEWPENPAQAAPTRRAKPKSS
ncbi:MAG: ATP-dependent helicase HrpB [Ahrensia sp.]|nr:ATP-dependent helicase HrpB [Ahrensia sp.]